MFTNYSVIFTERQNAQLLTSDFNEIPDSEEIVGKTLVSIISSGSETGGFMGYGGSDGIYPVETGYACIMEVLSVGSQVTSISPGDYVFAKAPHRLYNKAQAADVFPVPKDFPPEKSVICRFPAVSMTSFLQSSIKPTEAVMVCGLGIVGLMCAQVMQHCGYSVYATDPNPRRRLIAAKCGLKHVAEGPDAFGLPGKSIGIGIDCSGNDFGITGMIPYIRQGGELALVGVPWKRTSDMYAHDLLREIFYSYLHVFSGFEWAIPYHSGDFDPNSNLKSMQTALQWIIEGSLKTDDIYELFAPADCHTLYPEIAANSLEKPCAIFDWRSL